MFDKDVRNIEPLGDTPIISGIDLRMAFDKASVDIKEYINEELVGYINDEVKLNVEKNAKDIEDVKLSLSESVDKGDDISSQAVKVYISKTATTPQDTSPQIRFANEAPTLSNYGKDLPVGSIVFVY